MFWNFLKSASPITVDEITLVICLRAHIYNPWVLQRLGRLASYYNPAPQILVVDYGSEGSFKGEIYRICAASGFAHLYLPAGDEIHTPVKAYNAAFNHIKTDFIVFCDVNFLGQRDLFARIAQAATEVDMRTVFDTVLDIPAYYISQGKSKAIDQCSAVDDIDLALANVRLPGQRHSFSEDLEFVAPNSNIFLINKEFFSISGGYQESFAKYEAASFEYFIRLSHYSSHLTPATHNLESFPEIDNLKRVNVWRPHLYHELRAINQQTTQRTQRAGLRIFHF
jgi:predicted glycosyltransferase involved in capsule biosynthesis